MSFHVVLRHSQRHFRAHVYTAQSFSLAAFQVPLGQVKKIVRSRHATPAAGAQWPFRQEAIFDIFKTMAFAAAARLS